MRRLAFALFLLLPLASCTQPDSPPEVTDVWARDTVGSTANAAVFMTIKSDTADRLVAASTPVAAKTDLMTMKNDGGTMEMIYVDDIAIPARTPVHLDAAGLHVWLADLHQPLKNGEGFELTLQFEKAGERRVRVAVLEPSALPPMSGMDM